MGYPYEPPGNHLEHFGVKGMHWGHHKAKDVGGSAPSKPKKKPTTKEIHAARQRQFAREVKLQNLESDYYLATTKKGRLKTQQLMNEVGEDYLNGKDAKIAARYTTGEKWLVGIGLGLTGASAALAIAGNMERR